LSQKRAVFPAVSSREVTLGQMRKISIHFIIFLLKVLSRTSAAYRVDVHRMMNLCKTKSLFGSYCPR